MKPSLQDVKADDTVCRYDGYHHLVKVLEVTDKHIICDCGLTGHVYPVKFLRKNGNRHGCRESISAISPEEANEIRGAKEHSKLVNACRDIRWDSLTLAQLRAVKAIITT